MSEISVENRQLVIVAMLGVIMFYSEILEIHLLSLKVIMIF